MQFPSTRARQAEPLLVIASQATAREALASLRFAPSSYRVVGVALVSNRVGAPAHIDGTAVLGHARDLAAVHGKSPFTAALVCLPVAMAQDSLRIRETLAKLGVAARFLAPITDLLAHPDTPPAERSPVAAIRHGSQVKPVDLAALVGRTSRPFAASALRPLIQSRCVLITGAGGSIGSELARLVAKLDPAELVLMERAENALFEIDRQLAARAPDVPRRAILHDVAADAGTQRIFARLRPNVVFHAAAHKHVPLMEDHPVQAIANNVLGAVAAARSAIEAGADRFIFISTDKAVYPSSVMGATKRLAELAIRRLHETARAAGASTRLRMVRFGNVLGSNCSVLPIWEKQITEGGPVTVTDPRMTRFFMTIPEAATLVMQAAALTEAQVGEADLFVLDMGEPVRIFDLALRFVQMQGFKPVVRDCRTGVAADSIRAFPASEHTHSDQMLVDIVGTRPGEKLHEELAYSAEDLCETLASGVLAWSGKVEDPSRVDEMVHEAQKLVTHDDPRKALRALHTWFATMETQGVQPVLTGAKVGAA